MYHYKELSKDLAGWEKKSNSFPLQKRIKPYVSISQYTHHNEGLMKIYKQKWTYKLLVSSKQ